MLSLEDRTLPAAPVLLQDFTPDTYDPSSYPSGYTVVGDRAYFVVSSALAGGPEGERLSYSDPVRLMVTDGTAEGTKSIAVGLNQSPIYPLRGVQDSLYFLMAGHNAGLELWVTSGTPQSTHFVKDIRIGFSGSSIGASIALGDRLYFSANDGIHGAELWTSDGTEAGTFMVRDIRPGGTHSNSFTSFGVLGDRFLFGVADQFSGVELWISDGTEAGTQLLKDIRPGGNNSSPSNFVNVGATTFFTADDGAGVRLWKSDGTTEGTVLVMGPAGSFSPTSLTRLGDELFFVSLNSLGRRELWKTDGTASGTLRLTDGATVTISDTPSYTYYGPMVVAVAGRVFFYAHDAISGYELWTSDGTLAGTRVVTNIAAGSTSTSVFDLKPAGNCLFFRTNESVHGPALWALDGATLNLQLVYDSRTSTIDTILGAATGLGDDLLFTARSSRDADFELWKSNGTTAGTAELKDINPLASYSSVPFSLVNANGTVYFTTYYDRQSILWKSDGTPEGTIAVTGQSGTTVSPSGSNLAAIGNTVYFTGYGDWNVGEELWKTDGTAAGTVMVKDIWKGSRDSTPWRLTAAGGVLYFNADDSDRRRRMWRSDGTAAGTVKVTDPAGYPLYLYGNNVELNGRLFFTSSSPTTGVELWSIGPGETTATLARDITPGLSGTQVRGLFELDGVVYLRIWTANREELWKTDGTPAGTMQVFEPGALPDAAVVMPVGELNGSQIVWTGEVTSDPAHTKTTLWRSDGTAAGTKSFMTFTWDRTYVEFGGFNEVRGRLFFLSDTEAEGQELWVTDGTAEGTKLFMDIHPGPDDSQISSFMLIHGVLYFIACDNYADGLELWKTDGTVEGTVQVADLNPDGSSQPYELTLIGTTLYFTAYSPQYGAEVWSLETNSAPTGVALSQSTITENSLAGTTIGFLTPIDSEPVDDFTLELVSGTGGDDNSLFAIADGALVMLTSTNYESRRSYSIRVRVADGSGLSAEQVLTIQVNDIDEFDVTPPSDGDSAVNAVLENASDGTLIGITAFASDGDGSNRAVTYSLTNSAGERFTINAITGVVTVADGSLLDYEAATLHTISVQAASSDGSISTQSFTIAVTDVDEFDISPITDTNPADNAVPEHSPVGTPVGITASASDADGSNSGVTYSLWNTHSGRFAIDPTSGVVTVANSALLNRESQASWTVTVLATSQDGSVSVTEFTIAVTDVDEFNVSPIADTDPAPNRVLEHSPIGTAVGIAAFASDADATTSGVTYSLWDTRAGRFAIDPVTGVVSVGNPEYLDREGRASWTITVLATSQDGSVTVKEFTVDLVDVDEYNVGQVFDLNSAPNSVAENAPNGTPVGITGFGIDLDATNSVITYSLFDTRGGRFAIHPTTGVVTIANGALIDRESAAAWAITIVATSQDGSVSVKEFTIAVQDVDEHNVGQVFDVDSAPNAVSEHAANGTAVGVRAIATDLDATSSVVTYSLTNNAGGRFAINGSTGVITVANAALLDREAGAAPAYDVTVQATSQDGSTSLKVFTIQVTDADEFDVSPVSDVNAAVNTVVENSAAGTLAGITARATDADASGKVIYSLTNNAGGRFQIDPVTGVVSVAIGAVLDFETQTSHDIAVKATSSDSSTSSQAFTIAVTNVFDAPRITLSNSSVAENLPSGAVVGTLGTADVMVTSPVYGFVTGAGSTDNSKFQITGNQLKTRSSFNFETKSSYSIRVQMRPASGIVLTQVFTIQVTNVNEGPTGLALSAATIAENNAVGATVGTLAGVDPDLGDALNYTLVAGSGSTDNARFTIDGNQFKAAAVFDYETKRSYSVRVRVTDANGLTYEKVLTISVSNGPG